MRRRHPAGACPTGVSPRTTFTRATVKKCWKKTAESSESRRGMGGRSLSQSSLRLASISGDRVRLKGENVNHRTGSWRLISIVSPEFSNG
jgi:hypothetical protein